MSEFGVLGRLKIVYGDGETIEIAEGPLNEFFDDDKIRELLRLQKEALEEWLENEESFLREVVEEERRYGFDIDKYPPELIEKLKYVEGLDEDIASAKKRLAIIKQLLGEASP
ncbi:hypothetical protein [Thermococcus sp.]|uniref:hypothetical protein n=1 Tax=Thermococcus sp. TaxID=35749 RepID=UPI0025F39CDE|nr:hypothetical protein [Thermococcus sp.]